jgi:hypothetical protein
MVKISLVQLIERTLHLQYSPDVGRTPPEHMSDTGYPVSHFNLPQNPATVTAMVEIYMCVEKP